MIKGAFELAEQVGFFHWELEFPDVFPEGEASGFDVVLGNPPWERIKLQEQGHFVDVPEIATAANKAARERAIAAWRQGDERQRTRIALFDAAKYRAEAESRFGVRLRIATGSFQHYVPTLPQSALYASAEYPCNRPQGHATEAGAATARHPAAPDSSLRITSRRSANSVGTPPDYADIFTPNEQLRAAAPKVR